MLCDTLVVTSLVASMVVSGSPSEPAVSVGPGSFFIDGGKSGCGELLLNGDSSYESGWGWAQEGNLPPYYGAFAECYEGPVMVCSAVFDLTTGSSYRDGLTMDVYLWTDYEGQPGAVQCMLSDVDPGPVEFWPRVSRHVIDFPEGCCSDSAWWVGYWGTWVGESVGWYVGADLDGPERTCPLTNIAPGLGYPTGWTDVSIVWGPTRSLGIGAMVRPCETTPTTSAGWGEIKALFSARGRR